MADEQRITVPADGGRVLEALVAGPDDALPLVFHTGTPSGLVWNAPLAEAAAARGLRTVLYARPGYGASTPQPGRLVADAAADVDKILERIGADEFVTAGWSGGGPHALACAALLPVRCLAAATIAGAAPYDSPGLDWMAGMAEENHEEFRAALAGGGGPDHLPERRGRLAARDQRRRGGRRPRRAAFGNRQGRAHR
jgi:pimeloyl-ACP methyl ester carboxylesterase